MTELKIKDKEKRKTETKQEIYKSDRETRVA